MKNKNRGQGNKTRSLKPFPKSYRQKIPMERNIKLDWVTYGKLRMIKTKFEFKNFNSTVDYLIACWRKR